MLNVFFIMVVASASLFSAVALEGDANPANTEKESRRQSVLKVRDNQQDVVQDKRLCAQTGDSAEARAAETHRLCQEIVQKLGVVKLEDDPIENKSSPFNEKFERSKVDLLHAREAYFNFHFANPAVEQLRKLQGSLMGVSRLLASGEFQSNLEAVSMLRARQAEVEKMSLSLIKQHPRMRDTLSHLEAKYGYALGVFAYQCTVQAGLDMEMVIARVRSRDDVRCDADAVSDYTAQEVGKWRKRLRPKVTEGLTCVRGD